MSLYTFPNFNQKKLYKKHDLDKKQPQTGEIDMATSSNHFIISENDFIFKISLSIRFFFCVCV